MSDKEGKEVRIFGSRKNEPRSTRKMVLVTTEIRKKIWKSARKADFHSYHTQICYNDPSCEQIVWILISRTVNFAPTFRSTQAHAVESKVFGKLYSDSTLDLIRTTIWLGFILIGSKCHSHFEIPDTQDVSFNEKERHHNGHCDCKWFIIWQEKRSSFAFIFVWKWVSYEN